MRPFIAILTITLALICLAMAQSFDFVPNKPCTDNSNAAANTAFVHSCASGGGGGGVTSFNGRIGVVAPQTGDYAFSNISGVATGAQLPFPSASTIGGTESGTAPANQFMTGITTLGVPTFAQPSFTNLSGTASNAQIPVPTPSALGGVESITCGAGQFINVINASGVPSCATPAGGGGGTPGGSNGQVQFNNSGAFGGLTNVQLTADIQTCTSALSGAVPAGGGNVNTFLNGNCVFSTPAGGGNVSTSSPLTTGNCVQATGATTVGPTTSPCSSGGGGSGPLSDYISIKNFGAIGDGTCHPLSGIYGSLAAAQSVYPFVSDLTQCVDWAATQQAINQSYVNSQSTYCPTGNYQLSNPLFVDQANNTQGSYSAWAVGTTYGNGANVTYNGIPWQSQGSGNVGNPPTSSNNFPSNLQWNSSDTFPIKAVSISNASPAVITIPAGQGGVTSAVTANMPLVFHTQQHAVPSGGATPALPTGLNVNQVYYVIGGSINTGAGTYQVSATPGGAAINTSSVGVGVFFVDSQVWQVAPVTNASGFASRVSFIGPESLSTSLGCLFTATSMWMNATVYLGPQNGIVVKHVNLQHATGGGSTPPYRCNRFRGTGQGQNAFSFWQGHVGFVQMDSGGGSSRTYYEGISANGYFTDHSVGYSNGSLSDSNTWVKSVFGDACIGVEFTETQAFINTLIDMNVGTTTGIKADLQEGAKILGGNYSVINGIANSFTISSVSASGNILTATVSSPDQYLRAPMCAFNAGYVFNVIGPAWGNSSPLGNSCGYNIFTIKTTDYGIVPFYVGAFNPITNVITLVLVPQWSAIYEGNLSPAIPASVTSATTLFAAEMATIFDGLVEADTIHIENPQVPYTLICNCGPASSRAPEIKHTALNSGVSFGQNVCCNQNPSNSTLAQFYAQQTVPFITAWQGDVIIDDVSGGSDLSFSTNLGDRVGIGVATGAYVEARHTNNGPAMHFMLNSFQGISLINTAGTFNSILGLVNAQLSGNYYEYGGQAFGGGVWDSALPFTSMALYSFDIGANNYLTDIADFWRIKGWGATPMWGVRPAAYAHSCILPSQVTQLGSLPTITYKSTLKPNLVLTAGGTGYTAGTTVNLSGGTAIFTATIFIDSVGGGGAITGFHINNFGVYSTETTTFGTTGGTGTGATFGSPVWYVNYAIPYPILFGGTKYDVCDYKGSSQTHNLYMSTNNGWSYFQNLTTTNVPLLSWSLTNEAPFVFMNQEALELMFPGLVISLTCNATTESFVVLEVHPTLGYIKVVRADNDGSNYLPAFGSNSCSGTTIVQAGPNLINPAN